MKTATVILVLVVLFVAFLFLEFNTSRPDGVIQKVHPYRRIMFYLMPDANGSTVYFDSYVRARKLLEYLEKADEKFQADMTHAVVAAIGIGLAENPKMNQFVSGRRLYARVGRFVSFTMKRKKLDKKSKIATVKMEIKDTDSFRDLCEKVNAQININRSDKKTYTDKELSLFEAIPRPVLGPAYQFLKLLDYYNLLPASFIANDPFYTSVFSANLGSLRMGAGYHHLYGWGTCPLFLMVGECEERPVVVDGKVVIEPILHLRYTYDERIDDGLTARFGIETVKRVLEEPYEELGCLADDGSDKKLLGAHKSQG